MCDIIKKLIAAIQKVKLHRFSVDTCHNVYSVVFVVPECSSQHTTECYFTRSASSWHDARRLCLNEGADLAIFKHGIMLDELYKSSILIRSHYYYIGLRRVKWTWSNSVAGRPTVLLLAYSCNAGRMIEQSLIKTPFKMISESWQPFLLHKKVLKHLKAHDSPYT